jgi:tetratricopeptide (TPR) repeat protein
VALILRVPGLGNVYIKQGRLDDAIQEYQAALHIEPRFVNARLALGDIYKARDQLDDAVHEYKAALSVDPNRVEARLNLGIVYGIA